VSIAATSPTLIPGYWLDRYELLCPIASGGMAEAWVARLQGKFGFEKLVAIKTILPKFAADPRFQRMFLDEARIASRIEHTNVAQTLDLGDERGVLYLVMEWVDGDALSKLHRVVEQKGLSLPPGILLRIVADICGGLHAAHELCGADGSLLQVVHRDVSPQNILVSTRGEGKLIDFGVAKARDRVAGDTNAGILKGRILYMAPEQALGREVDRRADLWAVGALLYHLLTGRPPYEGANPLATLHLLTSGRPPAPLPDDVPAPIAQVIRQALSHSRADRLATAAEMQAALERVMVEANVPTTIADVAQFVGLHLADRMTQRRNVIELALRAASERVRIQPLIALPRSDSVLDFPSLSPGGSSGITSIEVDVVQPPAAPQAAVPARPASAPPPPDDSSAGKRLPPGVAGGRRVLFAGIGALACVASAVVMFEVRSGIWHRTAQGHAETPPLAASIRPPPLAPSAGARSAEHALAPVDLDGFDDAPDAAGSPRITNPTAANRAPHTPPTGSAPPSSGRAGPTSKASPAVKSIPEVIDNGF
jgi:serine/threonine-protein kinase